MYIWRLIDTKLYDSMFCFNLKVHRFYQFSALRTATQHRALRTRSRWLTSVVVTVYNGNVYVLVTFIDLNTYWLYMYGLICESIGMFIDWYVYRFVCLSIGICIDWYVYRLVYVSIGICIDWYVYRLVCLSIGMCIDWYVYRLVCLTVHH